METGLTQSTDEEPATVLPWLRWAGGKRSLAPRLVPEIMATKPELYIEPFLGGGAIALAMPRLLPKILSDANPHLIDCWLCMQNIPSELFKELKAARDQYGDNQPGYIKARAEFNTMVGNPRKMWARRSALLIYLNAHCFNGLWRTNSAGQFNVPWGKLDEPRVHQWDEFVRFTKHLRSATIQADSYVLVLTRELGRRLNGPMKRGDVDAARRAMRGVAVFSDSPYDGTFDGYTKGRFDESEQRLLSTTLANAAAAGAAVWATNSDTPLIREIYAWADVENINEQHNVGSKPERRGKRGCVLIRGGAAIRGS